MLEYKKNKTKHNFSKSHRYIFPISKIVGFWFHTLSGVLGQSPAFDPTSSRCRRCCFLYYVCLGCYEWNNRGWTKVQKTEVEMMQINHLFKN